MRKINYGGNDLEEWEQQSTKFLPAWMAFDFKMMYAFFQAKGLKAAPEDIDRQTALLGRPPRKFEDFARETARMWRG